MAQRILIGDDLEPLDQAGFLELGSRSPADGVMIACADVPDLLRALL